MSSLNCLAEPKYFRLRLGFLRFLCIMNLMQSNDLFENNHNLLLPLAEKMRPKTLNDYVGQKHLLARGKPLRKLIESGQLTSLILWGPPGVGKTSLARLIASYSKSHFEQFSAVTTGIQEIKKVIQESKDRLRFNSKKTLLFIDEIHRFNKAQQDAFLPHVENGTVILIGATTENPSFEVNAPLISRSKVFVLEKLSIKEIKEIIQRSLPNFPKVEIEEEAIDLIAQISNGDGRNALNSLELVTLVNNKITKKLVLDILQQKSYGYDKKGDNHFQVISAFIKSMRGSDANAALYWLARMIKGGEDPVFIARRMVIFASEDIGNAQPTALVVATSCMQAVHLVGMPEAGIILAQAATYLSTARKSRSSYNGLMMALEDVDEKNIEPVPLHLRNASTKLMKELGYGKGYEWSDDQKFQEKLEFLPKNLKGKKYYFPPNQNDKR